MLRLTLVATRPSRRVSLTFANFVEFDSLYGHRRDVSGYARALEWFDAGLARLLDLPAPRRPVLFTADHGNDPTWTGTDHTRERVPVLVHGVGAGEARPHRLRRCRRARSPRIWAFPRAGQGGASCERGRPKIELHLHLEGAAPPAFIRGLAAEKHVDISGIFDEDGAYAYTDFGHFLRVYEAATSVLQTPEDYARLTARGAGARAPPTA